MKYAYLCNLRNLGCPAKARLLPETLFPPLPRKAQMWLGSCMQQLLTPPIHGDMPWYNIAKVTLFSEARSPMVALLGCIFLAVQKEIRVR
jgi:hypothetical protein